MLKVNPLGCFVDATFSSYNPVIREVPSGNKTILVIGCTAFSTACTGVFDQFLCNAVNSRV